jgi:hypothetical protein
MPFVIVLGRVRERRVFLNIAVTEFLIRFLCRLKDLDLHSLNYCVSMMMTSTSFGRRHIPTGKCHEITASRGLDSGHSFLRSANRFRLFPQGQALDTCVSPDEDLHPYAIRGESILW